MRGAVESLREWVFAYGTLKPGLRYADVAIKAGLSKTYSATLSRFDLYHLEPEGYPAIVPGDGTVTGVVLEIKKSGLALLDVLEGVDLSPPEYRRERHKVHGFSAEVWVYVYHRADRLNRQGAVLIPSGLWPPDTYETKVNNSTD